MTEAVIRGMNLGKRYDIGERERYLALRDLMAKALRAPVRAFSRAGQRTNHRREHIWALRNASFEIREGEVVGLIGRNGAGKTTLLKILARVTRPTEGRAEIRGRMGSLLEVGTGFHPELTGRENVFLSGAILGMSKKEIVRKFDEIVAFAEVAKFIDTPLKHYSSGMQMRLAFAVAAHLEPEILLVDEVLAVGDIAFQKKCMGKMGDVARAGRTIVLVSHNMAAIQGITKRCILLEKGEIALEGDVRTVVQKYMSEGIHGIPNELDTSGWSRIEGLGADVRVTRVSMRSKDHRALIESGESLVLEMDLKVCKPIEQVAWGFGVFTLDGVRLFQCHNTNEGAPYPRLEPGEYRIRVEAPAVPLAAGRYRLDVGVRCESKGLDWLEDMMLFEVLGASIPGALWLRAEDGAFLQESRWEPPVPLPHGI